MDKANEHGDRTNHAHLSVVGRKEGLGRFTHGGREGGTDQSQNKGTHRIGVSKQLEGKEP